MEFRPDWQSIEFVMPCASVAAVFSSRGPETVTRAPASATRALSGDNHASHCEFGGLKSERGDKNQKR
jgi:hypothetical protein